MRAPGRARLGSHNAPDEARRRHSGRRRLGVRGLRYLGPAAGRPDRARLVAGRERGPLRRDCRGFRQQLAVRRVSASPSAAPIPAVAAQPLAGKTVGIDPGHDGGNFNDPAYINTMIWNGRAQETCDTTGTQTAGGYTEAQFNFNVATDLRADLIADGARVVMTRHSNEGVGPCVTTRAQIINRAHADVAIDIHADGGPAYGRGFTVLEPVADGPNDKVISASIAFGRDVRAAMLAYTPMPESDYYGQAGIIERDDLAGLNLTTVPKILIECGNMPNATDASLLTSPAFQHLLARAFTGRDRRVPDGPADTERVSLMLDHVSIQCADVAASAAFYDAVLAPLGGAADHGLRRGDRVRPAAAADVLDRPADHR